MVKKYIIFDFDGTLANTNDIITASWQVILEEYLGHRLPVSEIEATFGEVLRYSIEKIIPGAPADEAIAHYRAYQDSHHDQYRVKVFEGVRELLTELRRRGCIIGVGTSRTAYSFWNYMKELDMEDLIDEVVTMNDVTSHKPDPETAEAVLRKMVARDTGYDVTELDDAHRDAAVMIGDAKYDIGCAQNAGIDSVLVGWSHYVDEEDMAASGFTPTYRIKEPADLLDIISDD